MTEVAHDPLFYGDRLRTWSLMKLLSFYKGTPSSFEGVLVFYSIIVLDQVPPNRLSILVENPLG